MCKQIPRSRSKQRDRFVCLWLARNVSPRTLAVSFVLSIYPSSVLCCVILKQSRLFLSFKSHFLSPLKSSFLSQNLFWSLSLHEKYSTLLYLHFESLQTHASPNNFGGYGTVGGALKCCLVPCHIHYCLFISFSTSTASIRMQ